MISAVSPPLLFGDNTLQQVSISSQYQVKWLITVGGHEGRFGIAKEILTDVWQTNHFILRPLRWESMSPRRPVNYHAIRFNCKLENHSKNVAVQMGDFGFKI